MNKEKYINDILKNIHTDKKTKNRIREDLVERIDAAEENDPYFSIVNDIGDPREVAKEFMENLEIKVPEMIVIGTGVNAKPYEYKSKMTFLGLPLVHINTGGRYQNKIAKGVIAIGDIALGVVSIGGISAGLISMGGISVGLVALGGVAIGGIAIGGIAIGAVAIGGIAIGFIKAIGGLPFLLK